MNEFHQNFQDVDCRKYKSLLIDNRSKDARITLYLYPTWFPSCKVSKNSKIIQPGQKYLHRQKKGFKFILVANFDDKREKKQLIGSVNWVEDTLIKVTESLDCIKQNLADYPQEKRICLRKMHFRNELTHTSGLVNWYDVLGLDMTECRKLKENELKEKIKKAYHEKIRIWHPDKNNNDGEIAMLIFAAKEILLDDEKRASYHNEVDYEEGLLSLKRYKVIFRSEGRWRRLFFPILSGLIFAGGIGLTVFTSGLGAPMLVASGAAVGTGLGGAGFLSGMHAISKKSLLHGFDFRSWLFKASIGFVGGAITGGAAAGITAGVVGIGSNALESSAATFGQYALTGAGSGAVGGVVSSVTSDAARKFVDGEEVTWRECLKHAVAGATIGAATGTLGGLVTKGIVNHQTTAGSAALEGEVVEQAAILTGAKRFGYPLVQTITRKLTESGTEAVMGTAAGFIEERLDDSVENQNPMEHVKNGAINAAVNVGKAMVSSTVAESLSHAKNEMKIKIKMRGKTFETKNEKQQFRRTIRHKASVENKEHVVKWQRAKGSGVYESIVETHELCKEIPQTNDATSNVPEGGERSEITVETNREINEDDRSNETSEEEPAKDLQDGTIGYKSEGYWYSKMVVTYSLHGKENRQEVSGNGRKVKIPSAAKQVEVRFQVRRPFWGDIMKYDRFNETWCKPYEPHVFRYERPPLERTFTISGNLRREAVTRVSDEYHEETFEMC